MPRVYDVDKQVEDDAGYVKLRRVHYRIRQYTVAERVTHQERLMEWQQRIEQEMAERLGQPETAETQAMRDSAFEQLREISCETVNILLEGVPAEVSESVTEQEFQMLVAAGKAERDRMMSPKMTAEQREILDLDEVIDEVSLDDEGPEGNVSREVPLESTLES